MAPAYYYIAVSRRSGNSLLTKAAGTLLPAIADIATATEAHWNPLSKFLSINHGPSFYALKNVDGDWNAKIMRDNSEVEQ
jgi:hypothetical protein